MNRKLPEENKSKTIVYFPKNNDNNSGGNSSFVTIYSSFSFSDFGNFSILKNISNANLKVNRRSLIVVIKKKSISLDMEIRIAGKPFGEIKEGEIAYYHKKEDYFLNELTLVELNLDVKYTRVKKGTYLILFYDDRIKIQFTLSK